MMSKEKQSNLKRQEFQEEIGGVTTLLSFERDKEKATRICWIQQAEIMKVVWSKCAAARGCKPTGGIATIIVPTDTMDDPKTCTNWTQLEDPTQVTDAVNKHLQQHFSQAKECTWTKPPLDVTMDFTGCCTKAEQILT
jgi:hypothetical protein